MFHPFHSNDIDRTSEEETNHNGGHRLSTQELLRLDRQHVWHPYAAAGSNNTIIDNVVPIESAHGVYLKVRPGSSYDTRSDGSHQELVDGMSNWWATIHGYNHPTLNHAIIAQVSQMSHIMFGGLTHEPAIRLCTKLCQLTKLDVCFLCDSGSVAVEVAMKMAIQYWHGRHRMGTTITSTMNNNNNKDDTINTKTKFITVRNGYHGDTFGTMSVCDPVNGMHTQYFGNGILQQHYFVNAPTPNYPNTNVSIHTKNNNYNHEDDEFDESHMKELQQTLELYHSNIAAMILEPIVQGAGGMRMYHPQYLQRVRELCTEYDILLIYDEIATGFGRTNTFFGHDHCCDTISSSATSSSYKPDIICLGKALTGGYMSLAATITTNHVADVIHSVVPNSDITTTTSSKPVLMHGPTFMGNPLACSVALASISLLESSSIEPSHRNKHKINNNINKILEPPQHTSTCTDWRRSVPMIEQQLRNELMECTESEHVQNVRVLGGIGVVEMKYPIQNMKLLQHTIVKDYNVWLRPFGKLIYTMPPYIISKEQLRTITNAIIQITRRRF
jgi:adenosylmethionine---8-amino-7-oxononanoate aminotransferase